MKSIMMIIANETTNKMYVYLLPMNRKINKIETNKRKLHYTAKLR